MATRMLNFVQVALALCIAASGSIAVAQATACEQKSCKFLDPSLAIDVRVGDLVSRMTIEEKVSQLQDEAASIPRLGVPEYNWWNEALHGVARRGIATVFPQAIALAATWDTDLLHAIGDTISTEARAKFNESPTGDKKRYFGLTFWSPNVNIYRDPRWGRGQETYGEDPLLTGSLAVAFIRGIQGEDPLYYKAIATPKHFAVHSGPESTRHVANVDVSPHDLEDTYLPAFRMAIIEGHADSVMCAYNAVNGVPACANRMLLQDHLVKDWGFRGYVVSDCDAVGDVYGGHHYRATRGAAAAAAIKAGTDLDCGNFYSVLPQAVKDGQLKEAEIDVALRRLFTARFRLGLFDPPTSHPFSKISPNENDSSAHRKIALQAASESLVLLENDGILPLKKEPKVIAVIGPTAEDVSVMQGNYNGTASNPVYTREGLAARFPHAKVLYAKGSVLIDGLTTDIPGGVLFAATDRRQAGLKGEYFKDWRLSGEPEGTRNDNPPALEPKASIPVHPMRDGQYAVRWSGILVAPKPGEYRLALSGLQEEAQRNTAPSLPMDQRAQFSLDGRPLALRTNTPFQVIAHLSDTNPHRLEIVYRHMPGDHAVHLQWQVPEEDPMSEAIADARQADLIVASVGLTPDLEGEEMDVDLPGFRGGDRAGLDLPRSQQHLLEVLAATGKPMIVVLNNGGALAVPWIKKHANALIEQWYPGEEGGDALAQMIAGDFSPSGKLPITFYQSVAGLPAFDDYSMAHRTYRYYDRQVLYPFGYGLGYTRVEFTHLRVADMLHAGESAAVSVALRNTSDREIDQVVEAYLRQPQSALTPHVVLAGFLRVHLAAGESRIVQMTISPRALSQVDAEGVRRIVPGEYKLFVGDGQPGMHGNGMEAKLRIEGTSVLPQ